MTKTTAAPPRRDTTLEELMAELKRTVPGFAEGVERERERLANLEPDELARLAARILVPVPVPAQDSGAPTARNDSSEGDVNGPK